MSVVELSAHALALCCFWWGPPLLRRLARRFRWPLFVSARDGSNAEVLAGAGAIIPMGLLIWVLLRAEVAYPHALAGLCLIAGVSFWDDFRRLSVGFRLGCHFLALGLCFWDLPLETLPAWLYLPLLVLGVGIVNAYNFMDGSNGMTAIHSLVAWGFLYGLNERYRFAEPAWIVVPALATLAFAGRNARARARYFAGDVGSISLGFLLGFLVFRLVFASGRWEYLLLLGVYGVDTGLTLLERLWRGENIFQSHRRHLFQYLVFNLHWPHLRVAWLYGGAQALLNVALVAGIESGFVGLPEAGLLLGFLVMVFWFIRIEVKRAIA